MLEIKVIVEIPGLMELAKAIAGLKVNNQPVVEQAVAVPTVQEVQTQPVMNPNNADVAVPNAAQAFANIPTQQAQAVASVPTVTPVQTTTHTYTLEELSKAAMTLMDNGKQAELFALVQEFGVASMTQLDASQYGTFATRLRGLGANI